MRVIRTALSQPPLFSPWMAHWVTCGSVLCDEPPSAVCVGGCVAGVGCGPDFGIASFTPGSSSLSEPWPRIVASPCSVPPRAAGARVRDRVTRCRGE
eukprot:2210060-Prymnesium_polylepis.1